MPKKAAAEQDAQEAVVAGKSQMWKHEDLAEYIQERTGYKADPQSIAYAFALRIEYRQTDRYKNLVETRASERKAEAAERKTKAERKPKKEKATAKKSTAKKSSKKAKAAASANEDPFS